MGKVLYHAVSSYQLLEVMLHRMLRHPRERAVLILPDFIKEKYPQYQKLKRKKFFDEVYLFPYLAIPHDSEEAIAMRVKKYYEKMIPHDIRGFCRVYVAGAHFYFTLYLLEKKISFCFFEDGAGMASRPGQLWEDLAKQYPLHAAIAKKRGLFDGSNPQVEKIICLKRAQTVEVNQEKYLDFSVEKELEGLNGKDRKKIIGFFIGHRIWTRAQGILLTQNFSGLGVMSPGEQISLYKNLAEDFLSHVPLIIKKHPDDPLDYRGIFPRTKVIRTVFPSELLPYVFFRKPKTVYAFNSTGCENLKDHFRIRQLDNGKKQKEGEDHG
ncbi:MAG: polysialyltransferase family glycosyltransferase [Ruminococcus sp.]